jgi:contractile injection system tube protein
MGDDLMAAGDQAARATITRLAGAGGIEAIPVRWNPASYRLRRAMPAAAVADPGGRPAPLPLLRQREELSTELFLDTTGEEGGERDARRTVEVLRGWMELLPGALAPPRVLFHWGTFRFAGRIEEIDEEWIRFDPDGTPVRGRLRITIRS